MATELLSPVLTGIKNINYFEGRLLSARDLSEQELANLSYRRQLGRVLGPGVVGGLKVIVTGKGAGDTAPVVTITAGTAVNLDGDILELTQDHHNLTLSRMEDNSNNELLVFDDCNTLPGRALVPDGSGLYVLLMSPLASYLDFAPKSGLQQEGAAAHCGRRYLADGIQFRLLPLDPLLMPDISNPTLVKLRDDLFDLGNPVREDSPARLSMLRNLVAHACFASEARIEADIKPFEQGEQTRQGFDALIGTSDGLSSCDVPLCLIYWTLDGITFLDHWSVRRRLLMTDDSGGQLVAPLPLQLSDAMTLQFQEHMASLAEDSVDNIALSRTNLDQLFRFLPASGAVAIAGAGSATGFFLEDFFGPRASGDPTIISHFDALSIEDDALRHKPIDVENTDVIQLYWIRENLDAVNSGASRQRFLFFTSRELHGFRETDEAYATLDQTWKSYNDMLRKQVLMPRLDNESAFELRSTLQTDFQAIIQYAMNQAMLAASRALNRESIFSVFGELHGLQKTLSADLIETFTGDKGLPQRQGFSTRFDELLDDADSGSGDPGLLPAINADSYPQVLQAQQAINTYVSAWSGQFVFGSIAIRHTGSPDGEILVPGAGAPAVFEITLTAFIDKRSEVNLATEIRNTPAGTWGSALQIRNHDSGAPISTITLNPLEQRIIDLAVTTPSDAVADPPEEVLIGVSASIPPPTDKRWENEISLTTGDSAGDPVVWQLRLQNTQPGGTTRAFTVPPAPTTMNFIFASEFLAARAPLTTTATFTATFSFANSSRSDWQLSIPGQAGAETAPGSGIFVFDITLESGGAAIQNTVSVGVPTSSASVDRSCVLTVSLATEVIDPVNGDRVSISDTFDPFTVTRAAS